MKKFVFLLLLSGQMLAQPSVKILKFIDFSMSKKVGSGSCFDLVDGAYMKVNRKWKREIVNNKYNYGEIVDSSEIKPGDVIFWDKMIRYDGVKLPSHVGIIYSVANGKIMVAEQNTTGNRATSTVVLTDFSTIFRPSYMETKEITFYRLP